MILELVTAASNQFHRKTKVKVERLRVEYLLEEVRIANQIILVLRFICIIYQQGWESQIHIMR